MQTRYAQNMRRSEMRKTKNHSPISQTGTRFWAALVSLLLLLSLCACGLRRADSPAESAPPASAPAESAEAPESDAEALCVVIDAGHQRQGNSAPEPIGPGAGETKASVTGGTTGRFTGIPEYELNLAVAQKLQTVLEARGYRVVMTRTDHAVNLSNRERAELAAQAEGDVFVRIHANGSDNPEDRGAMTICMTPDSPYNAALYPASRALSEAILDCMAEQTGCAKERVWETNTMSGINWSTIPVTIVEMGYMTNREEDQLLADDAYREKIALGIADGIDRYFAAQAESASVPAEQDAGLQQILDDFVSGRSASWDLYAASLDGSTFAAASANLPSDGRMISASLIKLFIAGALCSAVERGALRHDDVYDSLRTMITVSDNDAANRLVRLLGSGDPSAGMAQVNAFAQSIGCTHTQQNRLMLEFNGQENYTSAADCAAALRMIHDGTYVSRRWSEELLQLLLAQTVNNRLPQGVPSGTAVAHKTGDLQNLSCGDVGIVYGPSGEYLLCVINNHSPDDGKTVSDIVALSNRVYQYFNP